VFIGHNATNPARSSGRNGTEATSPWDTTSPTLRDLRAATARRQRVFGHNATSPVRTAGRNGTEAPCPSDTTPTLHRDPSGHTGRSTTYPSDSRMLIQSTFAGEADRLGESGWSPRGVEPERSAEHDGPGSTCPDGHLRLGDVCPSGRNGPRPAYLSGCNGQGLTRPSGATGSNQRTLAGATVGVPSTHRSLGTHHAGWSNGNQGQTGPTCSFGQDEPRSRTTFGTFGVIDGRWVSQRSVANGIRVVRIRLGQAIRDNRPFVGELYERHRSWKEAVSVWRGNNRRASGTERCTAPREGNALKGATPRALLARNKARTARGGVQGAQR